DGSWSAWGSWGQCDVTCDNGTISRVRACDNPAPAHGGDDCPGDKEQTTTCVMNHCPGMGWSTGSDWSICSVTCGTGLRQRSRSCQNPLASLMNNSCSGNAEETQMCSSLLCTDS
ncbi:TSP1-like protein, partial [Mya arenaria]